ncbi:hamartin-like [Styela clava]
MLRGTVAGSSSGGPPQQNIAEIIQLLESNNVSVIEETTTLVRDSLSSTNEPWLLNGLTDYYIASGNILVRRMLTGIRQPQHKNLLVKLDEYLQKTTTRYAALNLFGHIVRKDPSWIPQVVQSRAFATILKCLQLDNDVAALTVAMYVVATLLPKVPTQMGPNLNHLFGIYIRLVSWKTVRGPDISNLNMSNFDVALYAFFLCLYGMYPCGFVEYLRNYYCKSKGNDVSRVTDAQIQVPATTAGGEQVLMEKKRHEIFQTRILPMLQQVRLHPNLILYTKEMEVTNDKWRKMECHDIMAEISQIPIEISQEKVQQQSDDKIVSRSVQSDQYLSHSQSNASIESETYSTNSEPSTETTTIWSPSMEIGLSTPPPSRSISPTRELSDDKSKADVSENINKSKSRPNTLAISHSFKGNNLSTPCTPTQSSLSFEFDKGDGETNFLMVGFAGSSGDLSSTGSRKSSSGDIANEDKTKLAKTLDISKKNAPANVSTPEVKLTFSESAGESCITDFSPALLPSSDHLTAPSKTAIISTNKSDSLFIGKDNPTIHDILHTTDLNLHKTLSARELVEKEIQLAIKSDNVKQNTDIDWLHFGQSRLNEKDLQSLEAGYLQIHCALLYEQHRRQQHAIRARRLMRKIYESSALQERNKALCDTLSQKNNEIAQLKTIVKNLKSEYSKKEKTSQNSLDTLQNDLSQLSSRLKSLHEENMKLKHEKETDLAAIAAAQESDKQTQAELYQCKLQFQSDAKNKEANKDLRLQVERLQKEMLVVEELSRKMETIHKSETDFKVKEVAKHEMMIQSYEKESARLKDELRKTTVTCDYMRSKSEDMEKLVIKKNRLLEDQKKYLEDVKSLARSQIQAMESKYQAQKSISMRMEVQIMELYGKLIALEGENDITESISQTLAKPIQPNPLSMQNRYGHLLEASPELSPPIKLSMLEETSVATSELEASTGTDQ